MGQKVHPIGFRLGVFRDWHAHWYAKKSYGKHFLEDVKIRQYLSQKLRHAEVSHIVIDKTGDSIRVEIHSTRAGVIIGKRGQEITLLRAELAKLCQRTVDLSVQEVTHAELNASLVAQGIAEQISRRVGYKRLMKKAGQAAMKGGAQGIKVCISGRLGGSEIARSEWLRLGSVPLHTLRSDVDYSLSEAYTTYGIIGVKVWICRGEFSIKQ